MLSRTYGMIYLFLLNVYLIFALKLSPSRSAVGGQCIWIVELSDIPRRNHGLPPKCPPTQQQSGELERQRQSTAVEGNRSAVRNIMKLLCMEKPPHKQRECTQLAARQHEENQAHHAGLPCQQSENNLPSLPLLESSYRSWSLCAAHSLIFTIPTANLINNLHVLFNWPPSH
ncbi:hypothetical protein L7F22_057798 [Adiantum nelumboides]|nr:hypothetical protein [Adiantum nelumboides]